MANKEKKERVGGWEAPCVSFDYGKMEREAQRECEILRGRLQMLKDRKTKDAEEELIRRREVCMLTDIYYEQRHKARLFHKRAGERDGSGESPLCPERRRPLAIFRQV